MIFDRFSTSFRDSLSGLYSEAYFAEVFQREWHRMLRENDSLSILIVHPHLNIDNPNDQLSFKLISEAIEASTKRSTDIVCRFQSNEIAVGLFNLNEEGTETIVNRIIQSIEPQLSELVSNIDLSIGAINVLPTNQIQINDIFERTEQLANMAELKGKNNYQLEHFQVH
ncbi:MAG: diguanylate cyclase (GGDEF)-like protein [Psychrosphaera sp.]|jgi:diguanylate cyclase (GGDEF)-like protein|uniref:diguanylate cyclase n=1 Tax=Psychrosphaera sp. F3M07 TaxID=2841560 RepID=UPI001C097929|nr:diguanylate cyclase [Psychrosphaera sp. F3M07]MBU2916573.1 diguanylate cyclase [Psychrosphaera sp. F3M07]